MLRPCWKLLIRRVKASLLAPMVIMRNAAKRKDAATVVVRVQAAGGVEAGGARRAENDAGAAAVSEDVHEAKSANVHDPAARIVVDVIVDAKAPFAGALGAKARLRRTKAPSGNR